MSQYASVKKRTKDAKAPCPFTFIHNARLDKNIEYLLPKHLRLKNYHMTSISNATKTFNSWKRENEDRYEKIRNRKLRSDAHRLESLLIILSEEQVNKCNPNEIWERAKLFKEWFEMKYETIVRTMDWHRDEGHSDEDENDDHKLETRNNHIHLEFDNVNNQGKMVRRLFSKGDLKIFQDKIAEIYSPLGFIRGKDTTKRHRDDKPKRGLGQEAFRSKKKAESREKNIKREMELLGEELQKWQAKDTHYTQLAKTQEELQKKLLKQEINYAQAIQEIKNESQKIIDNLKFEAEKKDVQNISDATKIKETQQQNDDLESAALKMLEQHKEDIEEKNREIDELEDKNNILEESFTGLIETKDIKIKELQGDIAIHEIIDEQRVAKINTQHTEIDNHKKSIKDKNSQIEELESTSLTSETQHKEKIEVKDNEILSLNQQVQEFRKDVFSETWTWKAGNGKKYKSKNIDVVKQLEKKRTELEEDIETLKTENNTLTTTTEQKEAQIASDSTTLKDSQEKIKVLGKQVQELKDKEPEIIEVIKEVSIELTPEEIMQLVIETEHGSMKIEDVIEKQKEEISNQKESINKLYGEIYHDNGIDQPVSYKKLWEKEENKLAIEKPYKISEADQKEMGKLRDLAYSKRDGFKNGVKTGRKLTYKRLLEQELEKKPKEQPEEMVMAEVPNEQGEIEHKEVTIKLYNSILEAKIDRLRDDVLFWEREATKFLLWLEIDIDQSREYIEKEIDNKLWEKLSTSEKILKLEELEKQWQITHDSGEVINDIDVFMKQGDKIKGELAVERAKASNEHKRVENKKILIGVNEEMGENSKTTKIKQNKMNRPK